jgi:DNA topoisomerase-1
MPIRAYTKAGRLLPLGAEEEELLVLYVCHLYRHPDASQDVTFRANFWRDYRATGKALREVGGFAPSRATGGRERETRKKLAPVARIDCDAAQVCAAYTALMGAPYKQGCAPATTSEGRVEPVLRCTVERPGLFVGRDPEHPLRGRVRRRVRPEDVTVNAATHAVDASLPWKAVLQSDSPWLARWTCSATGRLRYIWLAPHATPRAVSERRKFDFARRVHRALPALDGVIDGLLASRDDPKQQQLGAALYLLRHLVLRVGKGGREGGRGAVGLTDLRRRHVSGSQHLTLAFKGKDMVPYRRRLTALPAPVRRILLRHEEGSGRLLFPHVSPRLVNRTLRQAMPGLTARVLRTHAASAAVQGALDRGASVAQALREAADLCNHVPEAQTTLHNYVDPRVLVAHCRRTGVRLPFPDTRFAWAADTPASYRFPSNGVPSAATLHEVGA